jgi:hypothetical protein
MLDVECYALLRESFLDVSLLCQLPARFLFGVFSYVEDDGSMLLRNVGRFSSDCPMVYPRMNLYFHRRISILLLFELQIGSRMASSGMLRRVALVRADVSEELFASFISVTRIGEI